MALSIKSDEAQSLARRLARLTGETMTEAVTVALRERLGRERLRRRDGEDLQARVARFTASRLCAYDRRPVTQAEWNAACGDDVGSTK